MGAVSKLQARCNAWNLANPVGTLVSLRRNIGDPTITRTRSEAQILSGHSAVVWLEGVRGYYDLDWVTPLYELKLEYV